MRDDTRPPRDGKDPPARFLRLAHPQPPPKPKVRRSRHEGRVFTPEEQARLRAALTTVRRKWTRARLAQEMGVAENTLHAAEKGRAYGFSAALAVRLARVAGVSLDAILRPLASVKAPCPTCGRGAI